MSEILIGSPANINKPKIATNTCVGHMAGASITTGLYNLCIGHNSGSHITTGSYNVCIGDNTGNHITTESNQIHISPEIKTCQVYTYIYKPSNTHVTIDMEKPLIPQINTQNPYGLRILKYSEPIL